MFDVINHEQHMRLRKFVFLCKQKVNENKRARAAKTIIRIEEEHKSVLGRISETISVPSSDLKVSNKKSDTSSIIQEEMVAEDSPNRAIFISDQQGKGDIEEEEEEEEKSEARSSNET